MTIQLVEDCQTQALKILLWVSSKKCNFFKKSN